MNVSELSYTYFCCGARNQSLLSVFNQERIGFEIDERSASFKALGRSKLTLLPTAICTTSGTAVAQCLPAMIEATLSDTPLLLITADRPKRMTNTGSPQTIDHEIITRQYRSCYLEVSAEGLKEIDLTGLSYPAHINVIIEAENEKLLRSHEIESFSNDWMGFKSFIQKNPRPLILLSHESGSMRNFIEKLDRTNLPFYAESMSHGHDLSPIRYEIDLVKGLLNKSISSVIRIGHTPVSKLWRMLEHHHIPVFSFDSRGLPALSYGSVMQLASRNLLDSPEWWETINQIALFKIDSRLPQNLHERLEKYPLSEMSLLRKIHDQIPEGSTIYLGNSLSIRFFEMIQTKRFNIFGNRGANGIDGQISTAIGLAQSSQSKVFCILGDMTTRYDLSSLSDIPKNLTLIIMNNYGGRIFDFMKMDQRLVMEHNIHFKRICEAFNLTYLKNDFKNIENGQVLEINPSNLQTSQFLKEWNV
jgi:2-succinyl-5-enolpyruvyl-6-hydroxy-3-cyclohexene-1-carboxylate synthase